MLTQNKSNNQQSKVVDRINVAKSQITIYMCSIKSGSLERNLLDEISTICKKRNRWSLFVYYGSCLTVLFFQSTEKKAKKYFLSSQNALFCRMETIKNVDVHPYILNASYFFKYVCQYLSETTTTENILSNFCFEKF